MARLNVDLTDSKTPFTSADLVRGDIYSRDDLKEVYGIKDATINTGVFRPSGKRSIWLFITQIKEADRTQYLDSLEGDRLIW